MNTCSLYRTLLFVIAAQLATQVFVSAETDELCHEHWFPRNGKCFFISKHNANFYEAKENCESMDSVIAPVTSDEDQHLLISVLGDRSKNCKSHENCDEFWIGVIDPSSLNIWTTADGTTIPGVQRYWAIGYPKSKGSCVLMTLQSHNQDIRAWKNENCARSLKYVCSTNIVSPEGNVALGRPATQSSTFMHFGAFLEASRAVDGNYSNDSGRSPFSCSNTNDGPGGPNWWRVQLDRPYHVQKVIVTNRKDCCADRLNNFIVGVTNSPADPVRGTYPLCGQYPSKAPAGATMTLYCDPNIGAGQYVIIQQPIDGTGWLTLCEVEVYATTVRN